MKLQHLLLSDSTPWRSVGSAGAHSARTENTATETLSYYVCTILLGHGGRIEQRDCRPGSVQIIHSALCGLGRLLPTTDKKHTHTE